MIMIKNLLVVKAVLWVVSAGTSRKVGARRKRRSEWSALWSGGRHDEAAY